ncbi:hypothetical protein [Erythrobacter litoralis]|uniref:hypothetical protein n=1 Tax=Erythrobacter litoralis TaxID=39960 RepID=UPI002435B718|nr:hypothetical protein [Erythrobacter litoralis]
MEPRSVHDDEEACVRAAVVFLGHEIVDLIERAEALDLDAVAALLNRAANLCSPEVPDPDAT